MKTSASQKLIVAGAMMGTLAPGAAFAAGTGTEEGDRPQGDDAHKDILVTGVRSMTSDKLSDGVLKTPQSFDVISRKVLEQQANTRLQDALKNVPGITLNAGEGSARGDTVNIRGFPAFNDFFLDGIRDAAIYSRDSFDLESIEVLKGPSAVLFGRGSTGGAINGVSKAPTPAPLWAGTIVGGTNDLIRGTADIDIPLNNNAAIRLNAMGERSKVAERDDVFHHRWGVAPSLAWGIGGPDTLTLSYLHFEENNRQDTGIPFIGGHLAPVNRTNYYGLDSDRATANVNIATARYRHEFAPGIAISNTLRYANYHYLSRVNSAQFGFLGNPGAPTESTPLDTILVGRDSPSNEGTRTNLINQTDFTAHFTTGPVSHTLVIGTEFGRERDNIVRFVNPLGTAQETPPTSLLNPDPTEVPVPDVPRTRSITTAYSQAAYIMDTIHIGDHLDVTGGVRFDRFAAHFRPSALMAGVPASSLVPLDHTDKIFSPRAAVIWSPGKDRQFYFSYGTSFDPSAEALALSTKTANLAPVTARSYELGAKLAWLGGRLLTTAAVFQTQVDNAQITDPDHPTALILGGNQRVRGIELGINGHITDEWEIIAGYTYLDGKTVFSTTPGVTGKDLANVAHNAVNLWTEYEFSEKFELGIGANYLDKRWADLQNTVTVPGYVLVDAMASWSPNEHLTLRVNVNNIFNKFAIGGFYYSSAIENHAVPVPGRTALFTAAVHY